MEQRPNSAISPARRRDVIEITTLREPMAPAEENFGHLLEALSQP